MRPKKLIRTSGTEALGYVDIRTLAEATCRYDLSEEDVAWLQAANHEFAELGVWVCLSVHPSVCPSRQQPWHVALTELH